MTISRSCFSLIFAAALFLAPALRAQSNASPHSADTISAGNFDHYLWTEEFSGSTNSEGQVFELDSTAGYLFSDHFTIDAGVPVYFVHASYTNSTGGTTTTSNNGLGDAYLQLRLSAPNPVLTYKSVLTGTVPTGSTSSGFSTGHATVDWTNHFDHKFGDWTPFAEAGIGNSIPERFIFNRPYASYGPDAHFQAGTGYHVIDWLDVSASAYDIAPWGTQMIFSRLVTGSGPPIGVGKHGRVFETSNRTTGGSSLAADNGFSAEADINPGSVLDFSLGYSHSVHFQLDTFSFGVGVNMSQLLHRAHAGL